jgi:hypothetical protein
VDAMVGRVKFLSDVVVPQVTRERRIETRHSRAWRRRVASEVTEEGSDDPDRADVLSEGGTVWGVLGLWLAVGLVTSLELCSVGCTLPILEMILIKLEKAIQKIVRDAKIRSLTVRINCPAPRCHSHS